MLWPTPGRHGGHGELAPRYLLRIEDDGKDGGDAGCLQANMELNHERGVVSGWG